MLFLTVDPACTSVQNISIGLNVMIATSKNAPESDWIQGKITQIKDPGSFNENGILVAIKPYGIEGNVKRILSYSNLDGDDLTEEEISQILKKIRSDNAFETMNFELKETFWYDVNKSKIAKKAIKNIKLEYVIVDEVCAFLNTTGGHILLGVTNNGIIKGITIERDLQWMQTGKKDLDHFADMISTKLEKQYFQDDAIAVLVKVKPMIVDQSPLIVIKIEKSYKPFFIHKQGVFKDQNGIERHIDFIECVTRRETGLTKPSFESFLETWIAKKKEQSY